MRPSDPFPLDYRATSLQLFYATQSAVLATHSISIADPGTDHAKTKPGIHRLDLAMHDLDRPDDGSLPGHPSTRHIDAILDYVRSFACDDRVVIHCMAGRRRSTATAVIADIAHRINQGARPDAALVDAAWADLLRKNPDADPNRALIALGDDALGLGGLLVKKRRNMVRYIDLTTADY
jgi:predicted protein tyrosine phosphatase